MGGEVVYVSWGGTGQGEAVRAAVDRAGEAGQKLRYLAILDDDQFGELSPALAEAVRSELDWLLHAQLRMVNLQTEVAVQPIIDIRQGDVEEIIVAVVQDAGSQLILLGAPLPTDPRAARRQSIDELVDALREQTGAAVEIVGPES